MIWGTLRADDVQNIDPASLRLSGVGLRFTLGCTKTSGPGRRVGTLPGFISRTTGLSGLDWMSEGVRLLGTEAFGWPRDYLCPQFHAEWDDCDREFMDAEGLALQVRRFLSELRTPFRHEGRWGLSRALLIPGPMVRYWTGHSCRHTLPSLAAALEVGKEKRFSGALGLFATWVSGLCLDRSAGGTWSAESCLPYFAGGQCCRGLCGGRDPP